MKSSSRLPRLILVWTLVLVLAAWAASAVAVVMCGSRDGARASDAAALLGIPTSNLIHFLKANEDVWSAAGRMRAENDLPSLSKR